MLPGPRWGAYQASKAAFDVWFRSMGIEVRGDGVATSTIYVPLVYTRMSAPTPSLRGLPGMTPEQAAGLVARAIVRKSRTISPWWLLGAELMSAVFRRPLEWGMGVFFRRSTDSPSAIGTTTPEVTAPKAASPPSIEEAQPTLRQALRKAGLLTRNPQKLLRIARAILVQGGRPSSLCTLAASRNPGQLAAVDDTGSITYLELDSRGKKLALALRERCGVGPSAGLAIMARNSRTFLEALIAGSALGADVVLLNTEFPGPQFAQVLGHHQLGCVVHDTEFSAAFEQSGYAGMRITTATGAGIATVEDLVTASTGRFRPPRRQGKLIILTSGTTGVPKGAAQRSQVPHPLRSAHDALDENAPPRRDIGPDHLAAVPWLRAGLCRTLALIGRNHGDAPTTDSRRGTGQRGETPRRGPDRSPDAIEATARSPGTGAGEVRPFFLEGGVRIGGRAWRRTQHPVPEGIWPRSLQPLRFFREPVLARSRRPTIWPRHRERWAFHPLAPPSNSSIGKDRPYPAGTWVASSCGQA